MKRGEIWVGNLNPSRGEEAGKVRPVVIVQADELLDVDTPLVVVLPVSSHMDDSCPTGSLHVPIPARDRLLLPSLILVEQPRTLDRRRVVDGPLTTLTPAELRAVERILRRVLGM